MKWRSNVIFWTFVNRSGDFHREVKKPSGDVYDPNDPLDEHLHRALAVFSHVVTKSDKVNLSVTIYPMISFKTWLLSIINIWFNSSSLLTFDINFQLRNFDFALNAENIVDTVEILIWFVHTKTFFWKVWSKSNNTYLSFEWNLERCFTPFLQAGINLSRTLLNIRKSTSLI